MPEQISISEALSRVMTSVSHVAKRDTNQHARYNFRGVDAVVNAVGPALREHGVVVVPLVESVDYETVQTTTGKPSTACRVTVTYRFHGPDGSTLDCRVSAESWDAGDKACPKAMSVAFRTALLQSLALPTDEPDPDSHTYERAAEAPDPLATAKRKVWTIAKGDSPDERKQWITAALEARGLSIDSADDLEKLYAEVAA